MILEDNESFDINNDRASAHQVNMMNELFKDDLNQDNEKIKKDSGE